MSWAGRLFLGDGWLVYAGPVGTTSEHAHHAFQLLWRVEGAFLLKGRADEEAVECTAAVIGPDVPHTTLGGAPVVVMVYADPDTLSGRRLRRVVVDASGAAEWSAAGAALGVSPLAPPATWSEARATQEAAIGRLLAVDARSVPLHPALLQTRAWLREHLDAEDLSLDRIAREAHISGDRLSHLLNETLGVGLRPLILWLRLQRAVRELAVGRNLTAAAATAGFSDSAHMSRTFRRMFGLAPSDVVGHAEWILEPG